MAIYRLFTNSSGKSEIEELDISAHPDLSSGAATEHIFFRQWEPGYFLDWHPAPRRQYIISLSGLVEVGLEDGSTHRFLPGDARLVEDLTGKGHTSFVPGDEPIITAVIPLA